MNPLSLITGFFSFLRTGGIDQIIKILQGFGVIKDPEQEAEVRRQLAIERAQWVQMTTPPWERVSLWANTFVAVTRPGMAWVLLLTLAFFPGRLIESVRTLYEAGSLGLAIIAILLWSFYGRSLEKGVELWFTALAIKWGGPAAAQLMPALVPKLPEPVPPDRGTHLLPEPRRELPEGPAENPRLDAVEDLTKELHDRYGGDSALTEFDDPQEKRGPADR